MDAGEQSSSEGGGLKRWLFDLMRKASPRIRVLQVCAMVLSLLLWAPVCSWFVPGARSVLLICILRAEGTAHK